MAIPHTGTKRAHTTPFVRQSDAKAPSPDAERLPAPLQHGRVLEKRTHDDGLHKLDGHQHHEGGKVQSA